MKIVEFGILTNKQELINERDYIIWKDWFDGGKNTYQFRKELKEILKCHTDSKEET